MLDLNDLLNSTGDELAELSKVSDAETQAEIGFLLGNIKKKSHKALISHLESIGAIESIREDFEEHRTMDVAGLVDLIKTQGRKMTIAALISAIFVINSVTLGEPLKINFPKAQIEQEISNHDLLDNDDEWLRSQISQLTDEKITINVTEWAEINRYLPKSVTSMPGFYSYSVVPYLREIADNLSIDSPIRSFDFMKGAQIGATVGILENGIGYSIDHEKSSPCMLLTADKQLAQLRIDQYITPMLQDSGLINLIQSSDIKNSRKTGKTKEKLEWVGGGFLVPYGAQNADKLRSISIKNLYEDEVDAFPERVGKDGDPQKLAEARTKAYYETRKIARISTPLILGTSRIHRGYLRGDQRKYFVPCKGCGEMQELVFQGGRNRSDQKPYGLIWETKDNAVLPESVRYICKHCQYAHRNSDKSWMLPRGEWRPTATSKDPTHRSYHLNALYSPVGMFPWEEIAREWEECWDEETKTTKSVELLQEFYNNNLGLPFEVIGARIRFESVSAHRRPVYKRGQIPNYYAEEFSGSEILFLTCQVDVHKQNLAVVVMAWTRDMRCYVIDYWRFEASGEEKDCGEISDPVWGRLRELVEETVYEADNGVKYNILITFIDCGYANDTVVQFCAEYESGVYPILGRARPSKNQVIKEFAEFKTQSGTIGYRILVDHYKDRIAPVLRREWSEHAGLQKPYHFNAPVNISDKQLKELTVETRRKKEDPNGSVSYYWHRPGNARNELWDLLVYGHAAVEMFAWSICIKHFELENIDWSDFWDFAELMENDLIFGRSREL